MDILKKCVALVAILSISLFMVGCGGAEEEATEEAGETVTPAGGPGPGGFGPNSEELKKKIEEQQQ